MKLWIYLTFAHVVFGEFLFWDFKVTNDKGNGHDEDWIGFHSFASEERKLDWEFFEIIRDKIAHKSSYFYSRTGSNIFSILFTNFHSFILDFTKTSRFINLLALDEIQPHKSYRLLIEKLQLFNSNHFSSNRKPNTFNFIPLACYLNSANDFFFLCIEIWKKNNHK